MNRKVLLLAMVGLFVMAVSLMVLLVVKRPDKLLPESMRRSVGGMLGIDLLHRGVDDVNQREKLIPGWNEEQWNRPPTVFADESQQQVDSSILSAGFEDSGFERVLIRGQFGQWSDVSLGDLTGRTSFAVRSAGEERVVYVGKTVKMFCTPRMWYDKYGEAHDLTTVMMDYTPYLEKANLVSSDDAKQYFSNDSEMAVLARYSDSILEALMLVGFDCQI